MSAVSGRKGLARKLGLAGVVGAALVAFMVVAGIGERETGSARLREWTEAQAIPTVALINLNPQPGVASLDLPGRLEAATQAPIYARVSGYVKTRNVDIGDAVKAGQVLAEIEAPELDQQLLQAKADLSSAEANAKLSQVTLERGRILLNSAAVSQQDLDQRAADLGAKRAAVNAAEANVERLQAMANYERVAAPFDGVVTARSTDVGALINAGSSAGGADVRGFRPQAVAGVHRRAAELRAVDPDRRRRGRERARICRPHIRRDRRGIGARGQRGVGRDPDAARDRQCKRRVDAWRLCERAFRARRRAGRVSHPVAALIFDRRGLRVATVGADNRVALKTVTIARDLGAEIEIGSGLAAGDKIIASPADGLADGDEVRVLEAQHKS